MADVTFKRFEDLDGYNENFRYAARGLGVTSWGMNILKMPAGYTDYPEHDHVKDGQEEVYVVLEGSAKLLAGEESWDLGPGTLVRVGSHQKRKLVPGPSGATILALGGTPGKAYEIPDWLKG
jgi:mannose-6-phosphate isomerase-like protein (cupin superfamily)